MASKEEKYPFLPCLISHPRAIEIRFLLVPFLGRCHSTIYSKESSSLTIPVAHEYEYVDGGLIHSAE